MNQEQLLSMNTNQNEKVANLVEIIKKAANATHTLLKAAGKCKKAWNAIESGDKVTMLKALQEYYQEYAAFINRYSHITNVRIYRVPLDYYDSVTTDKLAAELQMVTKFIYIKELSEYGAKSALKEKAKKMLKNSGIFTDAELKGLF